MIFRTGLKPYSVDRQIVRKHEFSLKSILSIMNEQMIIRPPEVVEEELRELRFYAETMTTWDQFKDGAAGLLYRVSRGRKGHPDVYDLQFALMTEQLEAKLDLLSRNLTDTVEE